MKTTPYTLQRKQFWTQHIASHASSGQSVREYCQQHRISKYSFYEWRNRLLKEEPDGGPSTAEPVMRFAVVDTSLATTESAASIRIQLAGGDRIEVAAGTDPVTLGMVIRLLRKPQEAA